MATSRTRLVTGLSSCGVVYVVACSAVPTLSPPSPDDCAAGCFTRARCLPAVSGGVRRRATDPTAACRANPRGPVRAARQGHARTSGAGCRTSGHTGAAGLAAVQGSSFSSFDNHGEALALQLSNEVSSINSSSLDRSGVGMNVVNVVGQRPSWGLVQKTAWEIFVREQSSLAMRFAARVATRTALGIIILMPGNAGTKRGAGEMNEEFRQQVQSRFTPQQIAAMQKDAEEEQAQKDAESVSSGTKSAETKGTPDDPNDPDPEKKNDKPDLQKIHSDETIKKSNKTGYDYWKNKSTDEIVRSLRPGQEEPLTVKPDGRVYQGNTRVLILEERGVNVNSLPRDIIR